MSRIGIQPIEILEGVAVEITGSTLTATGPLGVNTVAIPEGIEIKQNENQIEVTRLNEEKPTRSLHGTVRSLISNAIIGAKSGFTKKLEVHGVGYRVRSEGANISLSLGWNHPVVIEPSEGVSFEVPDETTIIIKGHDKQMVGEVAARIRELRKPEPYKGKGIRYEGEYVRQKSAKAVAK